MVTEHEYDSPLKIFEFFFFKRKFLHSFCGIVMNVKCNVKSNSRRYIFKLRHKHNQCTL